MFILNVAWLILSMPKDPDLGQGYSFVISPLSHVRVHTCLGCSLMRCVLMYTGG